MITYSTRLDKAIKIAAWAHEKQKQHRKGTDIPYIIHPFGVMIIASSVTDDEDVLVSCLMHDILEDVNPSIYSKNDMLNDFGETVVRIVEGVTKDSSLNSWKEISDAYLANLEKASDKSLIVSAADKTHNLKSMLIDYQTIGQKLWDKFSSDKESQLWWYESTLKIFQKKIPNNKLTVELDKLVIELQKIVEISL